MITIMLKGGINNKFIILITTLQRMCIYIVIIRIQITEQC